MPTYRAPMCPFYCNDRAQIISCEGMIAGTFTHIRFPNADSKRTYLCSRCSTRNYLSCPVYQATFNGYLRHGYEWDGNGDGERGRGRGTGQ